MITWVGAVAVKPRALEAPLCGIGLANELNLL
jgi:hypothetical protein